MPPRVPDPEPNIPPLDLMHQPATTNPTRRIIATTVSYIRKLASSWPLLAQYRLQNWPRACCGCIKAGVGQPATFGGEAISLSWLVPEAAARTRTPLLAADV
ncbi:hypothetical protein B0T18DRAFT_420820 [Schizothecium vesticola]|uniref:Uncharacterized protein n=1 Tax=Schizothecium vesticola TaxID=314040 RepID=A0AA40BPA9_9PEZI|nr:hypothetical protein B0T18DRAFT_420820 [Schizothecium vesticola]